MSNNNKILSNFPWINEAFIVQNLRKIEKTDEISLKSFSVCDALGKGENFCSNLIRITVLYDVHSASAEKLNGISEKKISFVLKTEIENNDFKEITNYLNLFERETVVYADILPRVKHILNSLEDISDCYIGPM